MREVRQVEIFRGQTLRNRTRVEQFIHRANITLYRKQLSETNDAAKRRMLLKLLAEEEAKGDPLESLWASRWLNSELQSPT